MIVPGEFFRVLGSTIRINRQSTRRINRMLEKSEQMIKDLENARFRGQKEFPMKNREVVEHIRMRVLAEINYKMVDWSIGMLRFTERECPHTYNLMTSDSLFFFTEEE